MARPKRPKGICQDCGTEDTLIKHRCRRCYDRMRNPKPFTFEAAQYKIVENGVKTWQGLLSTIKMLRDYSAGFEKYTIEPDEFNTIFKIVIKHIEASAERERLENPSAWEEDEIEGETSKVEPGQDAAQPQPDNKVESGAEPAQPQPQSEVEVEQVSPQPQPQSPPSPPIVPQPPPKPFVSEWTGKKCAVCGKGIYTLNEFTGTCENGHYYVLPPTTPPQSIAPPTEPGSPAKSVSQEGGFSNDPPK